jgi:hypothetical protein
MFAVGVSICPTFGSNESLRQPPLVH